MANFGVEDGALTDACFPRLFRHAQAALFAAGRQHRNQRQRPVRSAKLQTGPSDPQPHQAGRLPVCSRRPPSPSSPTSRSTTPPLPTRACWPITGNNYIKPVARCAIHPGADGALLPASAGKGEKSPPSWMRQAAEECRQGVVRFLCRDDGMGAVYGAGRV